MSAEPLPDLGRTLLDLYDDALPVVYGYLRRRVGNETAAQDLASETFLAAVTSITTSMTHEVNVAWLLGIARHKLLDHYRRQEREQRNLRVVASLTDEHDDPWDAILRDDVTRAALADLGAHHRAALTLRHLDGLPVAEVATTLGRTLHATEALLVRARHAFRIAYEAQESHEADGDAPGSTHA